MADLELRGVTKSFGAVEVIRGVDLHVQHGEFCVFVGPSGCGKSTLLRMISGLESVTGGEIVIEGEVVNDVAAADRGLAMVFQSYALYPHMSVRENLSFGLENLRTPRAEIDRKVGEAAQMLQIDQLLGRRPKDLSGGQRQRVAIGRAVVREPRVFLFDEPLSNLDAELRVEMRGEIARLHRRLGNTMIYVTHDQVEAMTMADKIVVLRDGVIEQAGAPLELYDRPANLFVAGFIGSPRMNFLAGRVSGGALALDTGERVGLPAGFEATEGARVTLGVRPNGLHPADGGAGAARGEGRLVVEVEDVEQLGGESYVYARATDGTSLVMHSAGKTAARIGATMALGVDLGEAHLFDTASGRALRRAAEPAPA